MNHALKKKKKIRIPTLYYLIWFVSLLTIIMIKSVREN